MHNNSFPCENKFVLRVINARVVNGMMAPSLQMLLAALKYTNICIYALILVSVLYKYSLPFEGQNDIDNEC